jgi:MFS family permease
MSANPYQSPLAPSVAESSEPIRPLGRATNLRHAIVFATTLAAFLMYVDRACFAWIIGSDSFTEDISLTANQKEWLKGAFFLFYAMAQVPAGWLAERYGKRTLMACMILIWSAFTALTGLADGFAILLIARAGCGLAEAGAYPIAGSLLSRWAHPQWRAMASSVVALGGRLGLVLAPIITARVITLLDWRWAGWIYGAAGIAAAIIFYYVFRETPQQHPMCNEAERQYLAAASTAKKLPPARFPIKELLTDSSVWLMCAVQFLTNVGWAFAINSMSDHFKRVHGLDDKTNGDISTVALTFGIPAMLIGGLLTDLCTRRLGVRYGRLVPMISTRFLAAATFLACIYANQLSVLVVLFGLMIFWNDAGLPSMWAWAQDVGGRQVAPVLGWANMFGNFGAAMQPLFLLWITRYLDANGDGKEAFVASSAAFAVSGVLCFGINCEKPVVRE